MIACICKDCNCFSGDFHADFTGYTSSNGPGAGLPQNQQLGGSGAGHGGRGGRSMWAYYSAYSYDSLYLPKQMGSGGGTGKDGQGGRGGGEHTTKRGGWVRNFRKMDTKMINNGVISLH